MLTLLIKHFKRILILLLIAALFFTNRADIITAQDNEYIHYEVIELSSYRQTDIVIRAGEYIGKPGKRIYINNQTVSLPDDIPVRNDYDGKGFYVSEADINIKVAKAIVYKLQQNGVDVKLQITSNKSEDLNAAARISNKNNPYMYVSIHHNYYAEDSTGYFAMYNDTESSKRLAARLSDSIKNNGQIPQRANQLNTGYIGELNGINSTTDGVLLELGFFSNLKELEIICSNSYIDYISTQLANELTNTLNQQYK